MNPGDVLKVSITDPAGRVHDDGHGPDHGPDRLHGRQRGQRVHGHQLPDLRRDTAHLPRRVQHRQPAEPGAWAALEGGVLMQQEIGHFEACNSVTNAPPDQPGRRHLHRPERIPDLHGRFGGQERRRRGPVRSQHRHLPELHDRGHDGPVACPTDNAGSGALCEFSDGECFPAGEPGRNDNGVATKEHRRSPGAWTISSRTVTWTSTEPATRPAPGPNGSANHPTAFRYIGPFTGSGKPYPQIQFETDAPASESLCNTTTGTDCVREAAGFEVLSVLDADQQGDHQGRAHAQGGLRLELRQRHLPA